MLKIITNSWDFHEPSIRVVKRSDALLIKEAKWYVDYKSEPGYTIVSALFMGSGEWWGSNRNGDWFDEKDLIDKHQTFLKGHHYKHHQNSDPAKSYGDVLAVFYNPDMHRVEGIIKIDNEKSPDMIEKINKNIAVPLSMACKVKYDICSICNKKSYDTKDYCDHLKYQMCDILPDGKLVCAINPNPEFFDISEVAKGADPTACTFRKVASYERIEAKPDDIELEKESSIDKESILERLAEIEKQVIGLINSKKIPEKDLIKSLPDDNIKIDVGNIKESDLHSLAKNGILLSLNDIGYNEKCAMYSMLLNSPRKGAILDSIPTLKDGEDSFSKIASMRSMLFNYDRIYEGSNRLRKEGWLREENPKVLKIAALNLTILANNPILLKNKTNIVLQNLL